MTLSCHPDVDTNLGQQEYIIVRQVSNIIVDPGQYWRYESIERIFLDHVDFAGFGISGLDDDCSRSTKTPRAIVSMPRDNRTAGS
jgi:hypothetical protein